MHLTALWKTSALPLPNANSVHSFLRSKTLLVMKITAALLLAACLQLSAAGFGQRVSISGQNLTLKKVFGEIQKQTGFDFFYYDKDLEKAGKVTLDARNMDLVQVLNQVFQGQPLTYSIIEKTVVVKVRIVKEEKPAIASPPIEVTGVITDERGKPLEDVTVILRNSGRGTQTNARGEFTIEVPGESAVLEFSRVGFLAKTITIGKQTSLKIVLAEVPTSMDQVVVVGYGAQKKATVTGSISTVNTKEILKSPTSNVTNSLVGRLTGVAAIQRSGQPGSNAANILIRGNATYNDASPIVIVDGIERANFGDIDPNEIESISVLKDASSTAIFGIRGANGVIIVTTKAGKEGRPKVSYSGNISLQGYTGIPKSVDAYTNAMLLNEANRNDGLTETWTQDELQKFKDGSDPYGYPNINWFDYVTRKNYTQTQHNVNVSGGTKMVKYFASVGYLFEDGIFKKFESPYGFNTTPNYTRYNFRSNLDFNLSNNLQVGIRFGGRLQKRYQPAGLQSSSFSYDNVEGMISRILQTPAYAFPVTLPDGRIAQNPSVGTNIWNPYAVLTRWGTRNDDFNTIESNLNINYKLDGITQGLSFKGVFGYDSYYSSQARRNALWAAYVWDRRTGNITISPDRPRDEPLSGITSSSSGNINTNIQLGFNYNRSFGKHTVTSVALATRQLIQQEGAGINAAPAASEGIVNRTTYNYDEKYFVEFNAAYNGSERFAPGYQYGFFPAVSAGYTISKEAFMQDVTWVNHLKLRGSYGAVGNDKFPNSVSRFYFLTDYSITSGGVTFGLPNSPVNSPIVVVSSNGNPLVTWERGIKRNIGLESRLFNNAVTLNVDLFDEHRKDILTTRSSGQVIYGLTYPALNIGEVYNKGFEVELNLSKRFGNVTYGLNTQLSFARNRIVNKDEPQGRPEYQKEEGKRIGQFFGYKTDGFYISKDDIANSTPNSLGNVIPGDLKYIDYNGDKVITSDDNASIGYSRTPEYIYSFSPNITWKGLSVSLLFQGVANVSSDVILTENNNGQQMYEFMLNRWTPETASSATWPALHSRGNAFVNYRLNDFILQDASYLKLRNVEVSYNLPQRWLKPMHMSAMRVFLSGQNLYTWTKFNMYLDPENINLSNTDFSKQSIYPTSRIYNLGVNVQF